MIRFQKGYASTYFPTKLKILYGKLHFAPVFVLLSGCSMSPQQCRSSDAPVWQEHQDIACKKKNIQKGFLTTFFLDTFSANHKLSNGDFCFSLHGVTVH